MSGLPRTKCHWEGTVLAVQPRAKIWRYRMDNRTHTMLGFNLWLDGERDGTPTHFSVAISGLQQSKLLFRVGDEASGTAWPVENPKKEVADLYRAGDLRVIERREIPPTTIPPPFGGVPPPLGTYQARGARMLAEQRWKFACMTCVWANRSAVEIEYNFGKTKRYRQETFCYGPKSCSLYTMGRPRAVPYKDCGSSMDEGWMDAMLTGHRGDDE